MIAAESSWAAGTFALAAVSAGGTCASIVLKLKMSNQIMAAFEALRKELAGTYQRQDVYTMRDGAIEKRLNRLEGCRGPT